MKKDEIKKNLLKQIYKNWQSNFKYPPKKDCISKQDFYNTIMDNSNKEWVNDYRTGNYFDIRIF
jgi:hypothetical protein